LVVRALWICYWIVCCTLWGFEWELQVCHCLLPTVVWVEYVCHTFPASLLAGYFPAVVGAPH
jgi:hypothetical protein